MEASKRMVETKNSNGLDQSGKNCHPAGKPKGQRAMGYAMRHPDPEKGGRGNKRSASGQFSGVPKQRVSEARAEAERAGES